MYVDNPFLEESNESPEWVKEVAMNQSDSEAMVDSETNNPSQGTEGGPQDESESSEDTNEGIVEDEPEQVEPAGSPLYEDLRGVIANGKYKLNEMISKLSRLWVEDQITEAEYDALVEFARNNANAGSEVESDISEIVQQLMQRIVSLESKVAELEKAWSEDPDEPSEPVVTYEPYDPYKWYYKDMTCSFEGKNWKCIAPEGQVCTWSPRDYPAYWEEVVA